MRVRLTLRTDKNGIFLIYFVSLKVNLVSFISISENSVLHQLPDQGVVTPSIMFVIMLVTLVANAVWVMASGAMFMGECHCWECRGASSMTIGYSGDSQNGS